MNEPDPVTPDWVRDAVFYQVFPDRFARSNRVPKPGPVEPWDSPPTVHGFKGGDLLGIAEHLDHIEALGANALYLNPVFASASNHRYHTYDYLAVDPLLGGNTALRELIDACHVRGIRVVLDGVFNHSGRGFWPFHHVLETGRASPYRDWFYVDREALDNGEPLRAYPSQPLVVEWSEMPEAHREGRESVRTLGYRAWWDLPALPKLNVENPHVREYLLDVAEHWIRFGADGWRLDVPEEIADDFWLLFRRRVKAVDPDAYIVAEIWDHRPGKFTGDMFDAQMNYQLAAAILSFVGADRLDRAILAQHANLSRSVRDADGPAFAERLVDELTVNPPAVTEVQLNLLGSHDTPRILSILGDDRSAVRLATVIQMTLPGAPCIYYGDEIGLRGDLDPGCRGAFPWDQPSAWDRSLLACISATAAFRHATPALRRGAFRLVAARDRCVAYLRSLGDEAILVVVNAGDAPVRLPVELPETAGRALLPVALPALGRESEGGRPIAGGSTAVVEVAARTGLLFRAA